MVRYALMFTSQNYVAWHDQCVDALLGVENAALVAVIRTRKDSADAGARRSLGGVGWRLLRKAEMFVHPPRAWAPRMLPGPVADAPVMECRLVPLDQYAFGFDDNDVRAVQALDLDFILAFLDYTILRGPVLAVARYGIWSYHHGDPARYRGAPPGVWEVYDGAPRTGAVLQRLTERLDAGVILRQGDIPTIRHSFYRNSDVIRFESATWPAEICGKLVAGDTTPLSGAPFETKAPIRRAPNNRQALLLGLVLLWNNLVRIAAPWRRR